MEKSQTHARWWDWAAVGLQFVLLQTVASRLVATTWTPFLHLTQTFTYMGFVIGASLGYSTFHRRTVRWLTLFYMLLMLPLLWTLVIDQQTSLEEQLASVAGRMFYSTTDFFSGQPVEDPIFFVAVMSIAFWIISSWAGFTLVRNQNYLGAVLPGAIGLIIIQNYDRATPGRLWFLAFFAFMALLLLGRLQFLQNKKSWQKRRVFLSPDNTVDLTSSMAIAAGLIILVAWTVPTSLSSLESAVKTWNRMTRPWREFTQEMENAVSALESPSGGRPGEFFGSELLLGRGFPLSDTVIFEVQVPDLAAESRPPRFYWRGRSYDYFVDAQWYTTGTVRQEYSSENVNPFNVDAQNSPPARFVFNIGETALTLLYSPPQPVWVSRSGLTLSLPAGNSADLIAWHAFPSLRAGETYQVDAVLNNPNVEQLQAAGTDYPEWVRQKYLQLPNDFSPRIKALAAEITADAETPFEQASAITRYLRENIEYAPTIPEPPRNKDLLEWVLFDHKQSFCLYYASSEILMLRSLGVPARLAVGFAQGERDGDKYIVRRLNSHAWPEVYFPGIGWVEFEPTGNQSPLNRPLPAQEGVDENNIPPANDFLRGENPTLNDRDLLLEERLDPTLAPDTPFLPPIYLIPLLAAFAGLTIFLIRRYALAERLPSIVRATIERSGAHPPNWILRWERWNILSPIEKAFESINFGLRLLDQSVPVHTTPSERAAKLTGLLPQAGEEIKVLLDEHQTSLYTSRIADVEQARQAAFNIRKQVISERIRHIFSGKPPR